MPVQPLVNLCFTGICSALSSAGVIRFLHGEAETHQLKKENDQLKEDKHQLKKESDQLKEDKERLCWIIGFLVLLWAVTFMAIKVEMLKLDYQNQLLVYENRDLVSQNQHLVSENRYLVSENRYLVSENGNLKERLQEMSTTTKVITGYTVMSTIFNVGALALSFTTPGGAAVASAAKAGEFASGAGIFAWMGKEFLQDIPSVLKLMFMPL